MMTIGNYVWGYSAKFLGYEFVRIAIFGILLAVCCMCTLHSGCGIHAWFVWYVSSHCCSLELAAVSLLWRYLLGEFLADLASALHRSVVRQCSCTRGWNSSHKSKIFQLNIFLNGWKFSKWKIWENPALYGIKTNFWMSGSPLVIRWLIKNLQRHTNLFQLLKDV